ncbi:hypothetical protein SAY86_001762 [Trapa natans]|uniref:Uncharacterized protein n=1 Tax=Trapa natans TaxID=22666 RepID=A0AAN7R439_TRANT|nr:hypothetical protein SAY86_001762 [Trapa natans]
MLIDGVGLSIQEIGTDNMDYDGSTSTCEDDDSFDCSSSDCSHEKTESKELFEPPNGSSFLKDKYLSTSRFPRFAMEENFLNVSRYKYVSKFTIKLFEDRFDLQEHLLTLQHYHFMRVAN